MTAEEIIICQFKNNWARYDLVENSWLDATQPGAPNKKHCLSLAVISFTSPPPSPVEVYIKDGNSIIFRCNTSGTLVLPFPSPIIASQGNDLTLTISPAGAGVTTIASMVGYTIPLI